jgi:hypothetical protein
MLSNSVRSAVIAFAKTLSTEVAVDGVTVRGPYSFAGPEPRGS